MTDLAVQRLPSRITGVRTRTRLLALGVLTAIVVWTISTNLFPYHSVNHDEGVYLQQAAMLLDGTLFLHPPVEDAFRPWFFVESAQGLYPKYSPVPAAMFAVGKLLGGYRIALALIAAGCVILLQRVVARTFDDRTGYVAALVMLGSPLFLVDASVFLPYVPTMFWNLAFAAAYLRADDTGSRRTAALAGLAIGVAFFARPFTAVLFATPFVVHALWTLRDLERSAIERQISTAVCGLLGVGVALVYNAIVTGDPLLFPYQAFAPLDGLGFGRRQLLGYAIDYTVGLGFRANVEALWLFATRWMTAGILGTIVASVGIMVVVRRGVTARQAPLIGLLVTVPLGNVYFWGTLNTLGDLDRAGDGLSHFLGPYYHVDLLVPLVAFAAVGVLVVSRWLYATILERVDGPGSRVALAVMVILAGVGGVTVVSATADPIGDNAAVTDTYETAYEPFDAQSLDDAIVLLPTPHGDWLAHPFQALRNDPGYDDGPVYALQERQFAVLAAFPDRTAYRYTYHGRWNPRDGTTVTPRLQRVVVKEGSTVTTDFSLAVPASGDRLLVTLSGEDGTDFASVPVRNETVSGTIRFSNESARLSVERTDVTARIPLDDRDRVELRAGVDTGMGTGLTYGIGLPVERANGTVRVLTPSLEVCRDESLCGGQAGYVPGIYGDDVAMNATVSTNDSGRQEDPVRIVLPVPR